MSGENAPALPFAADRPEAGRIEEVATGIRRLVAPNPGPFTFTGTCTYVVGTGEVAVIDPGPEDAGHIARLLAALGSERVAAILVTHTHRDHSPGARLLAAATGAPILGAAPHRAFRALATGEANALEGSADTGHAPDRVLADGEDLAVGEDRLVALATPGHTVNHLAFALEGRGIVFSGDHVMGWSTSIVAPPDGAMKPYLASLESLLMREDALYFPGHGGAVRDPRRFVRGLLTHRRQREAQILDRLALGPATIAELVAANYPGLDARLLGAAGLSVFAHLESLAEDGAIEAEAGVLTLDARYHRR